ncbi:5'-nucleotidase C-terminal domain-containing protein [bacterium]|nr:5'-nucleotidase C-terminal domain-containing protein [bacterium]
MFKYLLIIITTILLFSCTEDEAKKGCSPETPNGVCPVGEICNAGVCVECLSNSDCTDSTKPICSDYVCTAGCSTNEDCEGWESCNTTTSQCELLENRCITSDDCSAALPVCDDNHSCIAFEVTIAHLNDTHSYLEESELSLYYDSVKTYTYVGGFAKIAAKIKSLKESNRNFMFLHAGDVFQGTLYFIKYEGMADLTLLNDMGLDAMVLGNHEFDRTSELLANFITGASFEVLSSNIDATNDTFLNGKIAPYFVKDFNGQKVGIIGVTLEDTPTISSPADELVFNSVKTSVQGAITELSNQGVNRIVVLSHQGYDLDKQLAQEVEGIDLIIGGHTHTLLGDFGDLGLTTAGEYPTVVESLAGKNVYVVQAWAQSKVLGKIKLIFNADGDISQISGNPILLASDIFKVKNSEGARVEVEASVKESILNIISQKDVIEVVTADDATSTKIADYKTGVDELQQEIISNAPEAILHVRVPNTTHSDGTLLEHGSEVAPIVAHSMYLKAIAIGQDSHAALVNAGGVRTDIPAGDITVGTAYQMMPFLNSMVVIELTGAEVKTMLEEALVRSLTGTENTGSFPYFYGFRYTAKSTAPHLTSVEVKNGETWEAIVDENSYKIVTNSFIAGGGDGYNVLKNATGYRYDTGYTDSEILIDYCKERESVTKFSEYFVTITVE